MGFSLTAATIIIGVALLFTFESFFGVFLPTVTDLKDSYDDMNNRMVDWVTTDIEIVNVSTPANGSNYDLNFSVNNTGDISLETGKFDILIDGINYDFTCSSLYLYTNDFVYFNVTNLEGTGVRRLKVVTDNGISDYYEYTIT